MCICVTPTTNIHMHRSSLSLDVCGGLHLISNAPLHSVFGIYMYIATAIYACMQKSYDLILH